MADKASNEEQQSLLEVKDADVEKQTSPFFKGQKPVGPSALLTTFYVAFNIAAAVSIVFANKLVLSPKHHGFGFVYFLTLLHTMTSWAGMGIFASLGMFKKKELSKVALLPLALAYVGYVVFNNLSLQINQVGFYQLCKITIAPMVLFLEVMLLGKKATVKVMLSVAVVCCGVALATLADKAILSSLYGVIVGIASVLVTSFYQIWAGTYQKNLEASSMQLLDQYCPVASGLLFGTVVAFEPVGIVDPGPHTILGYQYGFWSVLCILLSCVLGLAVNLSTFLVIGATGSLTYNIVGHIKTVLILAGGYFFFGDTMTYEKFFGVSLAMLGIVWYSHLTLQAARERVTKETALLGKSSEKPDSK